MRDVSASARELIRDGGFDATWVADLMYDGERRLSNVPIGNPRLSWDAGQFVAGSGTVDVVWSDDHARSMIPREVGDWFAPFGAELQVDCIVGAGVFAERVPAGRFVIAKAPGAEDASMPFQGRRITAGEVFPLQLKDPLVRVVRDEFPFPTRAESRSVWGEIQSITGFPVVRNLPDADVPAGLTYEGDKSAVLSKLFDAIGAWPMVDASGVLTARSKEWGALVDRVAGVVSAPVSLDAEKTYNRVVVEGKSSAGDPIYGMAEVTEGPLRVRNADGSASPFGVATYRYASELLTSKAACDRYARELLPRVSRVRGVSRTVTERLNPLRELGDVLELDGGRVRVQSVEHDGAFTRMVVEVPDE